jgi:hypothetical protein
MDGDCGDCIAYAITTTFGTERVWVDLSMDDMDGYQPGIVCRLIRSAVTIRPSNAQ